MGLWVWLVVDSQNVGVYLIIKRNSLAGILGLAAGWGPESGRVLNVYITACTKSIH